MCTAESCIVLGVTVLYCTVLYCAVLYCTVLYCTVLYMCTADSCKVLGITVPAGFTGSHCLGLPRTAGDFTALFGTVSDLLELPMIA